MTSAPQSATWNDGRALDCLLGDVSREHFFARVWQQRALFTHGPADRFSGLFDMAAFARAARECETLKAVVKDAGGSQVEVPLRPEQVDAAFASGATICAQLVRDPVLDAFRAAFAGDIRHAGAPVFNVYFSPDGRGFGLHVDDHPVWILQIEGSKRWWYSPEPGIPNALTTISFAPGVQTVTLPWGVVERPDESGFVETVLEAGDALYLPEGSWHKAAATGRSLALTLAVSRSDGLQLVQRALGPLVASSPVLLGNLPGFPAEQLGADVPERLRAPLDETLRQLRMLLDGLSTADLYAAWRGLAAEHGAPSDGRDG